MSQELFAQEICQYDDKQLDKYLDENNGTVRVVDVENLPESFKQRLKRRGILQPFDMNLVNKKLEAILANSGPGPGPVSRPDPHPRYRPDSFPVTIPVTDELMHRFWIFAEKRAYKWLIDDGGRPVYPIELLDDVAENPKAHKHLLLPMHLRPPHENTWRVFCKQAHLWSDFRSEQMKHRETAEALAAFNAAAEERRAMLGVVGPVVFLMDEAEQDTLTTWLEYLDAIYEHYEIRVRKFNPIHTRRRRNQARHLNWVLKQIPVIAREMEAESRDNNAAGGPPAMQIKITRKSKPRPASSSKPAPAALVNAAGKRLRRSVRCAERQAALRASAAAAAVAPAPE
ncbi:hypothetical protein SPI_03038 [Niveomyces insectorum RCEF 264]|uniref:Uncharacterized protein n=1 Tax=Niveomyces insectorum RCEF 264 TaxID=1081102 RepID=A0A167X0R0_9HYPO|nr:hypothetical protein SPI_03038 [Niveomyces insectorum RCEF 264]